MRVVGRSGTGATLGKFEGETVAIGPVLSFIKPKSTNGHVDILADLKWLNEVYTQNRLEGNTVFLKVVFKF